jgi:hypothetical protein
MKPSTFVAITSEGGLLPAGSAAPHARLSTDLASVEATTGSYGDRRNLRVSAGGPLIRRFANHRLANCQMPPPVPCLQ